MIKELLLLLGVSVPFLFLGIGSVSFLDPDEGMYGAIAREMAEGGDWITPHFNGVRYLEKPPLQFWLSALTISAFGLSEWGIRFWSALPAFGTALLIWRIGIWLYGRHGGILAAIIFVTNVGVFRYARVAGTDFLLVFSLTLAMYGFIKSTLSQSPIGNHERRGANGQWSVLQWNPILLFYIGMGLGVLSKGLIGVVFPLMIVALFILVVKASGQQSLVYGPSKFAEGTIDRLLLSVYSPGGILLFLVLVLPWHLLAALRNPGFFQFYIVDNQFLRFLNSRAFIEDDIPVTTFAFLLLTFVWFFPWSLFLPATIRQGFPNLRLRLSPAERLRLLVGLWALVVIGIFSLSYSKLEHYILPAIPPLSLMTAGLWARGIASAGSVPALKKWLGIGTLGCSFSGVGLLLLSDSLTPQGVMTGLAGIDVYFRILQEQGATFPFASVFPFVQALKGLGIALLLAMPFGFFLFHFRLPKFSFVCILLLGGAIALLAFNLDLVVEPYRSTQPVARALMARLSPSDLIVHQGSLEYSAGLPFYTGRRIYVLNGKRGDLEFGSRFPETRHLFLDNEEFVRIWHGNQRVFLVTRSGVQESDLKDIPSKKIFPVGQYGSRLLYTNRRLGNS